MLVGIFGTGRNGSTLLGRLLDGIEGTYVHPVEENFLCSFDDLINFKKLQRDTIFNARIRPATAAKEKCPVYLLRKLIKQNLNWLEKDYIQKTDIAKKVNLDLSAILPNKEYLLKDFVSDYLKNISEEIFGAAQTNQIFKSIETQYIEDYYHLFPTMKFVHIFREPSAVCSSAKRTLMGNKSKPAHYLGQDWLHTMIDYRWIPHVQAHEKYVDDPRHFFVTYESLVQDPQKSVSAICDFLGVAEPAQMDVQTVLGGKVPTELPSNVSQPDVVTPRQVSKALKKEHSYEEILTTREIAYIKMKCSKWFHLFKYKTDYVPTKLEVFFQYLALDKWEFMHMTYSFQNIIGLIRAIILRRIWTLKTYD